MPFVDELIAPRLSAMRGVGNVIGTCSSVISICCRATAVRAVLDMAMVSEIWVDVATVGCRLDSQWTGPVSSWRSPDLDRLVNRQQPNVASAQ